MSLLIILYIVLGYWATGKTIFANKILVSSNVLEIYFERAFMGILLGWCLIPIAIIKKIARKC